MKVVVLEKPEHCRECMFCKSVIDGLKVESPFYGGVTDVSLVRNIKCDLLNIFLSRDIFNNGTLDCCPLVELTDYLNSEERR